MNVASYVENCFIYLVIGACIITGIVINDSGVGAWSLILLIFANYPRVKSSTKDTDK